MRAPRAPRPTPRAPRPPDSHQLDPVVARSLEMKTGPTAPAGALHSVSGLRKVACGDGVEELCELILRTTLGEELEQTLSLLHRQQPLSA